MGVLWGGMKQADFQSVLPCSHLARLLLSMDATVINELDIFVPEVRLMNLIIAVVLAVLTVVPAYAGEPPKTEEQKTLYAIGATMARSLSVFTLSSTEFEMVMQGLQDTQAGKKSDFDLAAYNNKIQEFARARRKAEGDRQAVAGKALLEKAAKEPGAVKSASGMVFLSKVEGKGESPKADDTVRANYRGTLADGKEFDSSYRRGKPLEFRLDGVIKCWAEGLQKMKPGGKAQLVCPPDLAYGENGAGELILPNSTLAFEVELLEIKTPPATKNPALPAPAKQLELPGTK